MENNPLVSQEDPLAESMKNDKPVDDIFIGKGDQKISIKDIRKKVDEWSQKIDISDITKPDCENNIIPTRNICCAYIIFVVVSLIGLIGIFIWKYFRGFLKNKGKTKKDNSPEEA